MKTVLIIALLFFSCDTADKPPEYKSVAESLEVRRKVDSIVQTSMKNAFFDTVGLSNAPVKVLSAKLIKKEYSNFKSMSLSYKNVSGKTIAAIRFKWYGENAFGEPADMGSSMQEGFGGGFTDETLRPGKTGSGVWSILSRDGKKVVLAWPYEVAFEDGTKWKSN